MASILLAEDDESLLKFLTLALERAGHKVMATSDGLQALDALDGPEAFDLLLTDIVMPGMDGIELSQKATKKQPHLKVMFITGFAAVAMNHKQPAQSAPRILSKPFHLNDLVEQVETLLQAA
jgi:two-component system cell cycle response regulator CpdR